jgi:Galactose-3-O-sulfotransferase
MAFDFGFDKKNFRNDQKIQELLNLIETEFDLVLLSEYMEVSMVLLADLMCWSLEDVTFLKLNARPANQHHTQLSTQDKMKIRELNNVDTIIYTHFRWV